MDLLILGADLFAFDSLEVGEERGSHDLILYQFIQYQLLKVSVVRAATNS